MTLLLWPATCPDFLLSIGSSDSSRLWQCFDPDGKCAWGLFRQAVGNHFVEQRPTTVPRSPANGVDYCECVPHLLARPRTPDSSG